jgi:peptide/nickel transport system permease protein
VRLALGPRVPQNVVNEVRRRVGLDNSLASQYFTYLNMLLHGNLGQSLSLNASVTYILGQRVMPSLLLISYGLAIAVVIGVPLAIASAIRPNGGFDHGTRLFTTFLFGMPTFWLGLMIALFFGLKLNWFPVSGYVSGVSGFFRTLTLPALTLGLSLVVLVTRSLRSNLIQVLDSEYVEAARSRGISEWRIIFKHSMRNAVMPTFTILSAVIGFLIGGTVIIEQVFQIPGVGSLLVQAILARDYSLVQALALIAGTLVVMASLFTDILQAVLDPRVRLAK